MPWELRLTNRPERNVNKVVMPPRYCHCRLFDLTKDGPSTQALCRLPPVAGSGSINENNTTTE
jgi:hypothetical protein